MSLFASPAFENHEAVHAFHDAKAGLNCIIAIHSTALGPASGGVRMWRYADDQAALDEPSDCRGRCRTRTLSPASISAAARP